jgi:hypothetical protein
MTESFADDAAFNAAMSLPTLQQPAPPAEPQQQEEPEPVPDITDPDYVEDIPEFDARWKDPFSGLLYVGALTDSFELFGHSFTISTPTQTEFLQMGLVVKPFNDTVMLERAFTLAKVAAYLTAIDGKELPKPITTDPKETALQQRFQWVSDTLRREVVDKIHEKCLELDNEVFETLQAMGKA